MSLYATKYEFNLFKNIKSSALYFIIATFYDPHRKSEFKICERFNLSRIPLRQLV